MLSLLRTPQLLSRSTSTLTRRCISSKSFESNHYAGLYFHPSPSSSSSSKTPSYSLSFLPTPSPSPSFSPTTIGQLQTPPSHSSSEEEPPILPRYFEENPQFLDLVHEVLKENVGTDIWVDSAAKAVLNSMGGSDTFIHIADQRNPAEAQRTAQPQDIIASVLVNGESGKVVKESYERNKVAYRVVSELGLMRLPDSLMERLREACRNVREVEKEVAKERGELNEE